MVGWSTSRSGNCWDNAAMESFFSLLKTERIARKVYRSRNHARADVFDYIECFYNPIGGQDGGQLTACAPARHTEQKGALRITRRGR